jgi:TrmH family RNA methyltransferase
VARLSGRSARERAGRFVVEGPQAVREAVAASTPAGPTGSADPGGGPTGPGAVRELFATAGGAARFRQLVVAAAAASIPVTEVSDEVLAVLAGPDASVNPQGVLAVCDLVAVGLEAVLDAVARAGPRRPPLVAVLSQVRDPGNAGTVIRAADAAGADAVVLTAASVDVHNPKCVRATAGSLFHLPVAAGPDLPAVVEGLRAAGLRILAADGAGRSDLDDLQDAGEELAGPVAWVFGNEAWGLAGADAALADDVVRVPVHGRAESLNLATAATVCLYATARAQRAGERAERRRKNRVTRSERIEG